MATAARVWAAVESRRRRARILPADHAKLPTADIDVALLSADSEISWDPYGGDSPLAPRRWVFATPGTPRFIAQELAAPGESGQRARKVVIFSKSVASEEAVGEIIRDIIDAGAHPSAVAGIAGTANATEAVAAATANFDALFPGAPRDAHLHFTCCPPLADASAAFDASETCTANARIAQPLSERVAAVAALFAPATATIANIDERTFEALAHEVSAAVESAARNLSAVSARVLIMTGQPGFNFEQTTERIVDGCRAAGRSVTVFSAAAVTGIRCGLARESAAFRSALKNPTGLVIVAAANARRNDRLFFTRLAEASGAGTPVIAWVTRPSWWHNSRVAPAPLPWIALREFHVHFEPPDQAEAAPVIRAV